MKIPARDAFPAWGPHVNTAREPTNANNAFARALSMGWRNKRIKYKANGEPDYGPGPPTPVESKSSQSRRRSADMDDYLLARSQKALNRIKDPVKRAHHHWSGLVNSHVHRLMYDWYEPKIRQHHTEGLRTEIKNPEKAEAAVQAAKRAARRSVFNGSSFFHPATRAVEAKGITNPGPEPGRENVESIHSSNSRISQPKSAYARFKRDFMGDGAMPEDAALVGLRVLARDWNSSESQSEQA